MVTPSITALKPRTPFRWTRSVVYLILSFFSGFYRLPVYLLLITGFKQYADVIFPYFPGVKGDTYV